MRYPYRKAVAARLVSAALLSAMAAGAAAQSEPPAELRGFYAGAGVGSSEPVSFEDDYWYSDTESGDSATSTLAFAGYRFNPYVAVETSYLDAQDTGWSGSLVYVPDLLDFYNTDADLDFSASQLAVIGILPFARIWEVYLRGGLAFWDADGEQRLTPSFGGAAVNRVVDDSGTGLLVGLGGGVTLPGNFHLRLELQVFDIDEDVLAAADADGATLDTFVLDLQYRFGGWGR